MIEKNERTLLRVTGVSITLFGVIGFITTYFFDYLARGTPPEFGWIQKIGLLAFFAITCAGYVINRALNNCYDLILKYNGEINAYLELIDRYEERMGKIK